MNDLIAQQLINKAKELNESPSEHLAKADQITHRLRDYISGKIGLSMQEIQNDIAELTLYTSLIPVSIPLSSGAILSRAVKYEEEEGDSYSQVSRLSYISKDSGITPKIGRMNIEGESLFYACLNADANSVGTILSESRAAQGDIFNLLQCRTKLEAPKSQTDVSLHVVPIGISDYFRRGVPTPFNLHDSFREIYELYRNNTHPTAMLAMQLCDAFLTDVLSQPESPRLYDVTSEIGRECLKPEELDGILYPSTKFEGFPNLALKPTSVDKKIRPETSFSVSIDRNFGYGMYQTKMLRQGIVDGEVIIWD
jgi:hypothetical protein